MGECPFGVSGNSKDSIVYSGFRSWIGLQVIGIPFRGLLVSALLSMFSLVCNGQYDVKITNTAVEVIHNDVHIRYDIEHGSSDDNYYVWVEITDDQGNLMFVNSVHGDVGYRVAGGPGKEIIWDPGADSIFMDTMLFIQVFADIRHGAQEFKRSSLLLQSMAFPGLGLSRTSGSAHLVKGIIGYGCISGSIVFNRQAVATYGDYMNADTPSEAVDLLNTTRKQLQLSHILAYSAAGIWITDIMWTYISASELKRTGKKLASRVIFGPSFNACTCMPTLNVIYTF